MIGGDQCQVETGLVRTSSRGSPSATGLDVFGSCGFRGHSQFGVALGWSRQAGENTPGLGLVGKTTLKMPQDGAIGYGIAYGLDTDKAPGRGWRVAAARLFGVATTELTEGLLGHLNLGWERNQADRLNSTLGSIGVETDSGLRWAADIFGDDRARPWVSAGLLFPLADKISANLSYAQQFERPRVRQWTLGFKVEL